MKTPTGPIKEEVGAPLAKQRKAQVFKLLCFPLCSAKPERRQNNLGVDLQHWRLSPGIDIILV
jgi:hypothetical protein